MDIILVRHGKPDLIESRMLSAFSFSRWIVDYNNSGILNASKPPLALSSLLHSYYIISSDLKRAIDSAEVCSSQKNKLQLNLLREMDIPEFNFPIKLSVNGWLLLNRVLWLINIGSEVESFSEAKGRAKLAATELVKLANKHNKVAVFGHGLMNRYIAKELIKLGWNGSLQRQNYWDVMRFGSCNNSAI